jgi:hypothetical protein
MPHLMDCDISNGWEDSYYIQDNRYQCMECLNEFMWDSITYQCLECSEYIYGCTKCDLTPHGDQICTECVYDEFLKEYMMPTVDGRHCVPRIPNCVVPIYNQPAGLEIHPNGKDWKCPSCTTAHFLNPTFFE